MIYDNPRLLFHVASNPDILPSKELPPVAPLEVTKSEVIITDEGQVTVHIWVAPIPAKPAGYIHGPYQPRRNHPPHQSR